MESALKMDVPLDNTINACDPQDLVLIGNDISFREPWFQVQHGPAVGSIAIYETLL